MKLFVSLSVTVAAVISTVNAALIPSLAKPTLHIFGDSLSDVGTLQDLTLGLIPPPPYWKGRFSSGPVWNEYLAKLRGLELYNKAIGGSTSNNDHSALLDFLPLDLPINIPSTQDQINFFKVIRPFYSSSLTRENDIAVLEVGANDFFAEMFDLATNTLTVSSFVETLSNTVVDQLEQLRQIGFKNIIVADLAAIQYTPLADILNLEGLANSTVSLYNQQLASKVSAWASSAQGIKMFAVAEIGKFVEVTAKSDAVLNALGITNVKTSCVGGNVLNLIQSDNKLMALLKLVVDAKENIMCSNPSTNYFFDFVHPAERIQRLFGYYSHEMIAALQKGQTLELTESTILSIIKQYNLGTPAPKPVAV
ncbi:hypothetical protein LPJ78_005616 [Coemansia sp. RSA 989]|nr:hypothetical protein BX667DRAFT_502162 [Coemansia mojavensis]KAJ1747051.1 hypothetical protein LPJ79_005524 [Coemansia sp. RSA 1821]KAJ1860934.1 hypothetical protein LPJ78_005616 [Coemansia sp. RSA 989]KAJ1869237.1 hypothetical protein LPJ55_005497 [Coemansia sp. RSA 990]KAJ2629518.1 hypothetical protein H4R22_003271 [Coemansia sp. RSA 1290]KAJ2645840.1 hypothetical protein IWW40_005833 [Coemansia sp. RSA 1250]